MPISATSLSPRHGVTYCPQTSCQWAFRKIAAVLALGTALFSASAQPANGLLREVYEEIGGASVSDLTSAPSYPNSPSSTGYVSDFEAPTDVLENYGQRLRGYLLPPVSGNFTFWIASDDGGELWLSTDDTPARRRRIAAVTGWTSPREWSREAGQQSDPIPLAAGQLYYVEALMKEGGGGDNLAVRWQRPDGADEAPIPAAYLLPWGVALRAPVVTRHPVATNAVEGEITTFDVLTDPLGPATFQWRRNGVNIPGATQRVLEFGPVSFADQGARFSVALTNIFGDTLSKDAALTILPDTTRPSLVHVENRDATAVRILFSEPLGSDSAQSAGNYRLDRGATVSSARLESDGRTVTLAVSPLTFGVTYTLTVSGVTDRAATPNAILPGTTRQFSVLEFTPSDLGDPAQPGSVVRLGPDRFDVTGGGTDIGGNRDQFQFASQTRTGDFDLQVRLDDATISDPFLHAGLMARSGLDAGAPFAAVFASSVQLGCFFESRSSSNAATQTATPRHGFPVNYPQTWLRLRRVGNVFTGFAGLDGLHWTLLGTATLASAPETLFFGLAVASQNPDETATVRFRDLGPVSSTLEGPLRLDREPLGPFVRSTGLVLSELHYHPMDEPSGRDLEFLEIYNAGSIPEDLSGVRILGEIEYTFPEGTRLNAGAFLVVAAAPQDVTAAYGIPGVLGPYSGRLSNAGGDLMLVAREGDQLFSLTYSPLPPWPAAPDGGGHSLVLARASYGPADPRAWAPSALRGGSPGRPDPMVIEPLSALQINEVLARTEGSTRDFVELFNSGNTELDLSGCILTDNAASPRFVIPQGTRLDARAHLAFDEDRLGFALSAAGETVYLIRPDGQRVLDTLRFGPQETGVSVGRQPDGAPTIRRLEQPTSGAANASWRREPLVISELMYHPISQDDADEYLELYNRSESNLALGGWEFTDGIEYRIPPGVTLPAGEYLIVARDPERLRRSHPSLNPARVLGPYQGSLSDRGERVALGRPDEVRSVNAQGVEIVTRVLVDVAEVTYRDGGAWGEWSDGGGSSLELTDVHADPWMGANWADSDESSKGEWTSVSVTGRLDNGNSSFPPNQLQITHQGGGEALVDDVEVIESGTTQNLVANPGFEASATISGSNWTPQGNHATSSIQSGGAASGERCLRIVTQGRGDTGFNRIRTPLAGGLASGDTATLRARVRWVRGWPEVLFRLRGNWLELPASLSVPAHLGTPGAANSRRVDNAGPAISEVRHTPPLPAASEAVVVTARVADPDGIGAVRLVGRVDGGGAAVNLTLRDDGTGGDAFAGDGIYSATLPGRSSGNLVAFRIEATDGAATPAAARFPVQAPASECLVRWGDPAPAGTFAHYHLWSTAATEAARNNNNSSALNNLYRDATFVYGNSRVIYGAGFKDKGSPFKGGAGDWYVILPKDEPLLDTDELALVSTGNNGSDTTQLREQLCFTIARGIGASYLHRRYVRLYRNGSQFRDIMEDSEEPNGDYAERFFSQGERPDLYKIEDWFEFQDDGTSFSNVDATLERFTTPPGILKPARYRWSWRKRAVEESANNFTNLLDLVTAVNTGGSSYLPRVLATVDVDQWMRTFAFQRIVGNWDSYGMGRGKNMYAYKRDGMTWKLFSWDVDFALDAGGNGPADGLWGAGDPTINTMFDTPAIRRRLWQAYRDAVDGPMDPVRAAREAESRADVLRNNRVPTTPYRGALDYLAARRQTILNAYRADDVAALEITSNGGNTVTTPGTTVTLTGRAPLALTDLTVQGVTYPVTWTDFTTWRMIVPLTQVTNDLVLGGVDRFGRPIPGISDSIRVIATGVLPQAENFLVINEIQYDAAVPNASFLELHNASASTPFDLSNYRMEGVGYTFPTGSLIPAGGYLVLARNRAGIAAAYGSGVAVFGEFPGNLANEGERLALVRPDPTGGTNDFIVDEVQYGNRFPWPSNAAGLGPSLQLLDAAQDNRRPGNWHATAVGAANQATPGAANAGRASLAPFPPVWINEVLPENLSGPADNAGEREPFIELFNRGTNAVELSSYYLTDRASELTRWSFPPGTEIGPGGYLRLWADGQPDQNAAGHLHTGFRIAGNGGVVALVRLQGADNTPAVMDAVEYPTLGPGRSFGSFPDGDPLRRRIFEAVTPGAPNDPALSGIRVTINELMAANAGAVADPVGGAFDDWFELHNAGDTPVDLSGYFLTDNLANWNQSRIPAGYIIPAGGFLLVWADDQPEQNSEGNGDLHVSFRLSAAGEQIGLFDPNGRRVDGVEFGNQPDNTVVGRFPDGAGDTLLRLDRPSPRQPNVLAGGNRPPVLSLVGSQSVEELSPLQFTALASDPDAGQQLTFRLEADAPPGTAIDPQSGVFSWTPGEAQGPGSYTFGIRVTDNGVPPRSDVKRVTIAVTESNSAPALDPLAPATLDEGSLLSLTLQASDPDLPPQALRYFLVEAPDGVQLDSETGVLTWIPSEAQGPGNHPIRIRVSDDGVPPLSAERTLQVTVHEADAAPVIVQLPPVSILEGDTLVVTNRASDSDTPPATLRFSLPAGAPAGMTLDPVSGVLRWPTSEADGPGSHLIVIRVTQEGSSPLSDQYTLGVTVLEDNQPPTLAPIATIAAEEGALIRFVAGGTDPDLPAQTLTYSLNPGAPAGAQVDPVTGEFTWQTEPDAGAGIFPIVIRVSDDGPGTLSSEQTVTISLLPRFQVVVSELMSHPPAANAEYVELSNRSQRTSWSLGGLRLQGNDLEYTFPEGTVLAPGGALCVARNVAAFRAAYGAAPAVAGAWSGVLNPSGDRLRLVRPGAAGTSDVVLDELRFEADSPWPAAARGGGASLQLVDARRDNSRPGNWAVAAPFSGSRNLVPMTNEWRYYQSGPLPASWKDSGFNDGTWPVGRALLYIETAALPAPKSTPLTLGQNTYYFRTSFVLPSVPVGAQLRLHTVLDDGAVFYLNGWEVYRQNIAADAAVDFNTTASLVDNAALTGPFILQSSRLVEGTNVVAVEVHQANSGSSDLVFGCSLELQGGSVPAFTPGTANSVAAELPEFPPVWISEILARNTTGIADASSRREPWIELVNQGDAPVSLEGWHLSDSAETWGRWQFPSGAVLPPRSHVVLFADGQPGETTATEWHAGFRLNPGAGVVVLSRPQAGTLAVVDYLRYAGLDANVSAVPDPEAIAGASQAASPSPGAGTLSNRPPAIAGVSDATLPVGVPFLQTLSATDPDFGQQLLFELIQGPAGLGVSADGRITWTPAASQIGPHSVRVRVRDDGVPPLADETQFTLQVVAPTALALAIRWNGGQLELIVTTLEGKTHRIESAPSLDTEAWNLDREFPGTGEAVAIPLPGPEARGDQYFRVVVPKAE